MAQNILKWGILGAARVNERLLPAIIEAPNSQLVAIASHRSGAAKATLDKYAPNAQGVTCYDAVCTPDFFGFNNKGELQYRGRFDESRKETAPESTRDLFQAMKQVAETGQGPREQVQSIGCSIKWKQAD